MKLESYQKAAQRSEKLFYSKPRHPAQANCEPTRIQYVLADGEDVDINEVEVNDFSEDFFGMDLIDFTYNGKQYQSYVKEKWI